MQHVYGHADKYLLEAEMSPAQQVNFRVDKLATWHSLLQWKQMILSPASFRWKKFTWRSPGNGSQDSQKVQSLSSGENK
jgi:hypothetical protein